MHRLDGLMIWHKSMDLVTEVYAALAVMPQEEMYSLTSQIKRCTVSIPSNKAEGAGRRTGRDFNRFLDMGYGSGNELITQLLLAKRLRFLKEDRVDTFIEEVNEIQKMTYSLMQRNIEEAKSEKN